MAAVTPVAGEPGHVWVHGEQVGLGQCQQIPRNGLSRARAKLGGGRAGSNALSEETNVMQLGARINTLILES